jgi:hypothetical protein
MTTDELIQLSNRHQGLAGTPVALDPTIKNTDPNKLASDPDEIPNPSPVYRYVFKDGTHFTAKAGQTDPQSGQPTTLDVVDPGTALKVDAADEPSLVQQRQASAAQSTERTTQLQADRAQREKNQSAGKGYLTDAEVARVASEAASQGLTADQIAVRREELAQQGRQTDRQLDISAANNAIAAANNVLAQKRLELDDAIRKGNMDLETAKFEYLKAKDATDNQTAQAKLDLDRLSQEQQTANQQQANILRGQELAQRTSSDAATLAQRQSEQKQQARLAQITAENERARTGVTAAGDILTATQTAAQTGAGLLQNRVTQATGALNNAISSIAGAKMTSAPAGMGANLVGGLNEWVTQLGGGQPVYDSAAAMVNQANPAVKGDPTMAQQAYTALRGAMDLYKAQTGTEYVPAAQRQFTAPTTLQPPAGGYAQNQPGTYGVFSGQMPAFSAPAGPATAPPPVAPAPVARGVPVTAPITYAPVQPGTYGPYSGSMPLPMQPMPQAPVFNR